ncbi:hypothetical protein [Chryseosolibacter indicus]|uniref:Glycosyltransferase RgtA/B/C/D-like domain-containing protein n=1 Tax=Chryseosolibacter indicus TaxID=2782351 RepID=A0ABS5VKP7_9BACT|nr:hypothetical protein [Chryseosolibacter indicus]MBT1702024.1 hypothetical protein [Chryseosolibacter indicus]
MELRDLIVTPVVIVFVYVAAYIIRPAVTDALTKRYFIPALTVRIIGALALGMLYQFYYGGGDTFNFHTHGSRHIWDAFTESPQKAFKMIFGKTGDVSEVYRYASRIPFFNDNSSYTVIRIAAFIDLFTFSTYSATAVCFAAFGFTGSWMLFLTFYKERPEFVKLIAIATLFVPSVFFWGSGLLKDTITLGALGIATYNVQKLFIHKRFSITALITLMLSLYVTYAIKKYILLCFLPAVLLWVYARQLASIKSVVLKALLLPFIGIFIVASAYLTISQVGKDDQRYNLQKLGNTAMVTAYDIAYQTGRDAGSTYTLGELDGSLGSMIRLAPQAINVSLFRPYLWEVRNPLMVMSAMESVALLVLTIYVFYKSKGFVIKSLLNANVLFCLVFSITFAFAVGISTFNFGTLSRYKIPLLPFYLLALILIYAQANKERKLLVFEGTE